MLLYSQSIGPRLGHALSTLPLLSISKVMVRTRADRGRGGKSAQRDCEIDTVFCQDHMKQFGTIMFAVAVAAAAAVVVVVVVRRSLLVACCLCCAVWCLSFVVVVVVVVAAAVVVAVFFLLFIIGPIPT